MEQIFKGLFDSDAAVISMSDFLICIISSLIIGVIIAISYMYKSKYTKSFIITLAIIPAIVCVIIMMVNGNIGAGVAVAGAFGLVRFRSMQGTAKEISMIFLAMATGLITGMGYIGYGFLFTIILCIVNIIYTIISEKVLKNDKCHKIIKITIPEDLDYTSVFEDIFNEYTNKYELIKVKSTNMGSLFKLEYDIILKDISKEKEMIDKIRVRNGNLEIILSRNEINSNEL